MRRRPRSAADVELPAFLRSFDPAAWTSEEDPPGSGDHYARQRWSQARGEWCDERGVSVLSLLRKERAERRRRVAEAHRGEAG